MPVSLFSVVVIGASASERIFSLPGSRSRRHCQSKKAKSIRRSRHQDKVVGKWRRWNSKQVRPCSEILCAGILQYIGPIGVGVEVNGGLVRSVAFDEIDVWIRGCRLHHNGQRERTREKRADKPWTRLVESHRCPLHPCWHGTNHTVKRPMSVPGSRQVILAVGVKNWTGRSVLSGLF